jgi:methionyl-tRNA formyltransferase
MKIVWVGFHVEGIPALRGVLERGVHVEGVLTLKPEQAAKRSGVADYAAVCEEFGVPLYEIKNINDAEAVGLLRRLAPDLCFVIGWSQIVRAEALRTARVGMVGAHASLLPHNRGRAPINWALIKGLKETGNSLIWLAENVDEGDIIAQTKFEITPYDTCATLYDKVALSNREMILDVLPRLADGERPGRRQPHIDEELLPGRKPEDGLIDWEQSAREVYDFVRALTRPYPGAFSSLDGKRWTVRECALLPGACYAGARAGQVVGAVFSPAEQACGQAVACGGDGSSGAVVLLELEGVDGAVLRGRELSGQQWEGKVWGGE